MKNVFYLILFTATLISCTMYTPKTIPDKLIIPKKHYYGILAYINTVVQDKVKNNLYSSRPPIQEKEKPEISAPISALCRDIIADSVRNTLDASNLFNKTESDAYAITVTIKKYDIFGGGFRSDENILWIQYQLVNLKKGEMVFNELIKSHRRLDKFIFNGNERIMKGFEQVVLDNMATLVSRMHDSIR